jgi:hypothetical protein
VSALLVDAVVRNGDVHVTASFYRTLRQKHAREWGDGRVLKLRIEPADEAAKYHRLKHLHGHLLTPVSEVTGYTVRELKDEFKARFLPEDWMTSVTDMNDEQFAEFNRAVEQCIQEEYPDGCWERCQSALALYDQRTA